MVRVVRVVSIVRVVSLVRVVSSVRVVSLVSVFPEKKFRENPDFPDFIIFKWKIFQAFGIV